MKSSSTTIDNISRFDRIERKLDEVEFSRWKSGTVKSLQLDIHFKKRLESKQESVEHFRACLELQSLCYEKRSMILGGCDDFIECDGSFRFGTKTFFWRQQVGPLTESSWVPSPVRAFGGVVTGIHFAALWRPTSPILVADFDELSFHLHFTENLQDRIAHVRFRIDDYVFLDWPFSDNDLKDCCPISWPSDLSESEKAVKWRFKDLGWISLDHVPNKVMRSW